MRRFPARCALVLVDEGKHVVAAHCTAHGVGECCLVIHLVVLVVLGCKHRAGEGDRSAHGSARETGMQHGMSHTGQAVRGAIKRLQVQF